MYNSAFTILRISQRILDSTTSIVFTAKGYPKIASKQIIRLSLAEQTG